MSVLTVERKISETVVTGTIYEYLYTNDTVRKTLGFTVTARENKALTGESSKMIYSADSQSEWVYQTPMLKTRKNASSVTVNDKIYVLGGENEKGACKSFAAYDTEKKNMGRVCQIIRVRKPESAKQP